MTGEYRPSPRWRPPPVDSVELVDNSFAARLGERRRIPPRLVSVEQAQAATEPLRHFPERESASAPRGMGRVRRDNVASVFRRREEFSQEALHRSPGHRWMYGKFTLCMSGTPDTRFQAGSV
jgi:hypothetical protein